MKEMTWAEFAKANAANVTEPVQIRRYTKVVGTYYPEGFLPAADPPLPPADLGLVGVGGTVEASHMEGDVHVIDKLNLKEVSVSASRKRIQELEEEVKRLKKELAARSPLPEAWKAQPVGLEALNTQERRRISKANVNPDIPQSVFDGLPKQDREFFERKLGRRK